MGHCHSSAQFGGTDEVRAAGRRARPAVAEPGVASARPAHGVLVRLLLTGLRVYQGYFSPLMPSACKFYPSCSHYAYEAIELYGPRRGARLALQRLLRCRPLAPGGFDPVPTAGDTQRPKL